MTTPKRKPPLKSKGKIKRFAPVYEQTIKEVEKKVELDLSSMFVEKREHSLPTGLLSVDLLIGNGGITHGWNTFYGDEQTAKTTVASTIIHSAAANKVPIIKFYDYEGSFSEEYFYNFWNSGLDHNKTISNYDETSLCHRNGSKVHIYSLGEGETFFNDIVHLIQKLPDKIKYRNEWWYVFRRDKKGENLSFIESQGLDYDKGLLQKKGRYFVPAQDSLPQGIFVTDSYSTMSPREDLGVDEGNRWAPQARMFSTHIPRIIGFLKNKKLIVLGMNQVRSNLSSYSRAETKEGGGYALRMNSDMRMSFYRCKVPKMFENLGKSHGSWGHMEEESADYQGTDVYRYIRLMTYKNKVGGDIIGSEINARVWAKDQHNKARGIDPVFDCWQYLYKTNQLKLGRGIKQPFTLLMKGTPFDKVSMGFHDLKQLIVGTDEQKAHILSMIKADPKTDIIALCQKQLKQGVGDELAESAGLLDVTEEPVNDY